MKLNHVAFYLFSALAVASNVQDTTNGLEARAPMPKSGSHKSGGGLSGLLGSHKGKDDKGTTDTDKGTTDKGTTDKGTTDKGTETGAGKVSKSATSTPPAVEPTSSTSIADPALATSSSLTSSVVDPALATSSSVDPALATISSLTSSSVDPALATSLPLTTSSVDPALDIPDTPLTLASSSVDPALATSSSVDPALATSSSVDPALATSSSVDPALATSSSLTSSSATASATSYICGAPNSNCGSKRSTTGGSSKACSINGGKKKTTRSIVPHLSRRTFDDVSKAQANAYVIKQCDTYKADALDYTFASAHTYAVSKSGTFTNTPRATCPLTGLEGCTGIAVVSKKGFWMSHFMELAMDPNQKDHATMWAALMKDVTNGRSGKYTVPSTLTDIFDKDSEPIIYISRPKQDGKELYTDLINKILAQIKQGPLASAKEEVLAYTKMKANELDTIGETTARGKMLLEYTNDQQKDGKTQSPQQAMYRIWLEDEDHSRTWAAATNQQGTASADDCGTATKCKDEHTNNCLKDAAKTIPADSMDGIIEAVCNKVKIDVSLPVTTSYKESQIHLEFSSSQTGCHTSSTKAIPRTYCKAKVKYALESCPNPAGGFFGNKPLVWNAKGLGCVDINVYQK